MRSPSVTCCTQPSSPWSTLSSPRLSRASQMYSGPASSPAAQHREGGLTQRVRHRRLAPEKAGANQPRVPWPWRRQTDLFRPPAPCEPQRRALEKPLSGSTLATPSITFLVDAGQSRPKASPQTHSAMGPGPTCVRHAVQSQLRRRAEDVGEQRGRPADLGGAEPNTIYVPQVGLGLRGRGLGFKRAGVRE